jgi:hypothetical protein
MQADWLVVHHEARTDQVRVTQAFEKLVAGKGSGSTPGRLSWPKS